MYAKDPRKSREILMYGYRAVGEGRMGEPCGLFDALRVDFEDDGHLKS